MGRGAIERTFSPEFRNRLDAWIAFNPLTYKDILRVVGKVFVEVKDGEFKIDCQKAEKDDDDDEPGVSEPVKMPKKTVEKES